MLVTAGLFALAAVGMLIAILLQKIGAPAGDSSQPLPSIEERAAILHQLSQTSESGTASKASDPKEIEAKQEVLESLRGSSANDQSASSQEPASAPSPDTSTKLDVLQSMRAQ